MDDQTPAAFGGAAPAGRGVGPVLERFDDVRRIAVLRGTGLGDLMLAMPALESLAAAYPDASITLLGTQVHAALLNGRPGPVSRVEVLPVAGGIRPGQEDPQQVEEFFTRLRPERFDLAVQLHGGGRNSNPFLLRLDARHTIGTRTPDAVALERTVPYVYYQHETFRTLEVVGLAGAAPVTLENRLVVTAADREAAEPWLDDGTAPLVTLHPGATDPRRRWPSSSFAAVAAKSVADGCRILVVGDDADVEAADEVVQQALALTGGTGDITSAAGQLPVAALAAVLEASAVVVANDSGPRHLAQAVGTPTVAVYWAGNALNASPLGRSLHRMHLSWTTNCPVCGVDVTQVGWSAERCEHDFPLTEQIDPADVYADVRELRATSLLLRGR